MLPLSVALSCSLSAYWLGYSPATFNRAIYTWGVLVLFTLRYVMYRIKKWHYYGKPPSLIQWHFGIVFTDPVSLQQGLKNEWVLHPSHIEAD